MTTSASPQSLDSLVTFSFKPIHQGSKTFHFYIQDQSLKAKVVSNGETKYFLQIKDIPAKYQTNVDEKKIAKLKECFSACYFSEQAGDVLVNAKGLGGWNDDVHKGFKGKPKQETDGSVSYYQLTPDMDGSFGWAISVGLTMEAAKIVAQACRNVDYGKLGPTKRQEYHFNTNYEKWSDYSEGDSRTVLAVYYMEKAINLYRRALQKGRKISSLRQQLNDYQKKLTYCENEIERRKENLFWMASLQGGRNRALDHTIDTLYRHHAALKELIVNLNLLVNEKISSQNTLYAECFKTLGTGLHPLQDMFAHTKGFVSRDKPWFFGWQFHTNNGADNPKVLPQRYTKTESATKLYLGTFIHNTTGNINPETFKSLGDYILQQLHPEQFLGLIGALKKQGIGIPTLTREPPRQVVHTIPYGRPGR